MPRHWRPIAPDNPGPKDRVKEVKDKVKKHNGKVEFCGRERDGTQWWALVDVRGVADPEKMWQEVRAEGPGTVLLGEDEV